MKIARHYIIDGVEIMVLDGRNHAMPGSNGLSLLAHRKLGVGADRILVFTGTEEQPSFIAYDAEGSFSEAGRSDYVALTCYLRDCGISPNVAEMLRNLGTEMLAVARAGVERLEIHITEYFWKKALEQDAQVEEAVC